MTSADVSHNDPRPQEAIGAIVDVLGFRQRVASTRLDRLVEDYRDRIERKKRASELPTFSQRGVLTAYLHTTIFSDTILIWADATIDGFDAMIRSCAILVAYAIDIEWPLRGGLACGSCVLDLTSRTFVGQPIVNAYLAEQSQEWIGVALDSSVVEHPLLGPFAKMHDDVIEYDVPTKRGSPPLHHAIHWGPYCSRASTSIKRLTASTTGCRERRKYARTRSYIRNKCAGFHASS